MTGFSRALSQMNRALAQQAREAERAQRERVRMQTRAHREAERAMKAAQREVASNEREQKKLYVASREAEANARNEDLLTRVDDLHSILSSTLEIDDFIDLSKLERQNVRVPFNPGNLGRPHIEPKWSTYEPVKPSGLAGLFGGKRKYEKEVEAAQLQYKLEKDKYEELEKERLRTLSHAEQQFNAAEAEKAAEIDNHNKELSSMIKALEREEPQTFVEYFDLVLGNSVYPTDFPQHYRLAIVPESRQLVCEYNLPTVSVVPTERLIKLNKTRDEIVSSPRPTKEIKSIYASVVAQTALRTIHEIFEADRTGYLETVVFNGMVNAIDSRTGKLVRNCVISVRTTRDQFSDLNLEHVDPLACLANLNALISKRPDELAPVRPVLEFDMVDKRFIEETDILADLDARPNLLELTPTEFEGLIQNLFSKMGLDTRQTRASRDGGIDCVAFDSRPIFGGKVVIQAKRYKNTVDVSAVRDLYGSMHNEGATKGILVATSGYGPTAYEFASGKPLELIDGSSLLYLLQEHADLTA